MGLVAFALLALLVPAAAQDDASNAPEDIICRNDANKPVDEAVRVRWDENLEDVDHYEVHRSEDGGDFEQIATVSSDDDDSDQFNDDGLDADTVYRYRVRAVFDDGDTGEFSDSCRAPQMLDSEDGNFRVYYRPYSSDDAPPRNGGPMEVPTDTTTDGDNEYASRIGGLLEGTRSALTSEQVGFEDFAFYENDKPVPADLKFLGWTGLGSASTGQFGPGGFSIIRLNPVDMAPYDPSSGRNAESVGTTLHEAFHLQQFLYGGVVDDPASDWVMEGQAASVEDKLCVGTSRASCISLDDHSGYRAGYPGRVDAYLDTPHRDLTRRSYRALLFWTYLLEQYGSLDQEPEQGMDFLVDFWERARDKRRDTGVGTINRTLEANGESDRFEDAFENFVVANYTKDLDPDSVPETLRYIDQVQTPVQYPEVQRAVVTDLDVGEQLGPNLDDVRSWGARYYELRPDPGVDTVQLEVHQDISSNPAFYALLAVRDGELVEQVRGSGSDFVETLDNDGYDRVVLIVAGLREHLNYRWAVNAGDPVMDIVDPVTVRPADVGDAGDPDKFLAKLDVLDPDGDPVEGIALDEFTVTVGEEAVADDDLVSRAFVQGQYWLLMRAPEQDASGRYDLTVEVGALSDTTRRAVRYEPRTAVDNELVIDYSGSMGDHDKMPSARRAASLYLDTWISEDMAGLVTFNTEDSDSDDHAAVVEPLAALTSSHRHDMREVISGLTEPAGGTAIGEGLFEALGDLDNRGGDDDSWAIVLLSDGRQTVDARDIGDFIDEYEEREDDGDDGDNNPEVHTVALGPDADRASLQELAHETGGAYQFASLPDDAGASGTSVGVAAQESEDLGLRLSGVYRVVSEEVAGEQQVFAASGETIERRSHGIQVDGGAEELTVSVSSSPDFRDHDASLLDPSGTAHQPDFDRLTNTFWRVASPEAGEWTLQVRPGGGTEQPATHYQADAAVTSRLTIEAFLGLAPNERQAGRAMPILVSLSDTGPITGASVEVEVAAPDGSSFTVPLSDDGAHGDGAADDGFYGATYRGTHEPGNYVATISAEGSSGAFGSFARRARLSFGMSAGDDADGDGLPDWWETEVGTDPATPDGSEDPDDDGLTNIEEWEQGTHPLDADTDNGGESDGTDPDPLDPDDDRLPAPDAEAYAGVGEVVLRYSHGGEYDAVRIRRAPGPDGPFTIIADGEAPTGEYTDRGASNDDQFCYEVIGLVGGATSGSSRTTCATARTDPIPPGGRVVIDDGNPTTADRNVILSLAATDNPEPHAEHPGSPPRPEDAEESGVAEMRISNHGDLDGIAWEPFADTREWVLPPDEGPATVHVQYRDTAGNISDPVHDTIELVGDGDGDRPASACPEGTVPDAGFADTAGNVHEFNIDCIAWYGISQGATPDTYAPAQHVRRDQMASFIVRLLDEAGVSLPPPRDQGFDDIDGNTHAERINQLAELGITQGISPDRYAPAQHVRRDQMASFLVGAYEHIDQADLPAPASGFADTSGNPHETNIDKAKEAGFTEGTTPDTYSPANLVRRDAMASFLARTLQRGAADGHVSPPDS